MIVGRVGQERRITPSAPIRALNATMWREQGGSLYDEMGPEFTLLRFDPALDVVALEAAARNRGVPLKILDVEPPCTAIFYGGGLVLSRPDQHVAWRGDKLPADPLGLIDRIRGAANQEFAKNLQGRRIGQPVAPSLRSRQSIPSRRPAGAARSDP